MSKHDAALTAIAQAAIVHAANITSKSNDDSQRATATAAAESLAVSRALLAADARGDLHDLSEFLRRQADWSRAQFGSAPRQRGLATHIRRELRELAAASTSPSRVEEWCDIALLALDGLLRSLGIDSPDAPGSAVRALLGKSEINRGRSWPKPRQSDRPIEHLRDART